MSCAHHQSVVRHWSMGDFPDQTALHLDECSACRDAFDRRFLPPKRHVTPVSWTPLWVLAAAAILLIATPPRPHAEEQVVWDLPECFEEIVLPQVCEV